MVVAPNPLGTLLPSVNVPYKVRVQAPAGLRAGVNGPGPDLPSMGEVGFGGTPIRATVYLKQPPLRLTGGGLPCGPLR